MDADTISNFLYNSLAYKKLNPTGKGFTCEKFVPDFEWNFNQNTENQDLVAGEDTTDPQDVSSEHSVSPDVQNLVVKKEMAFQPSNFKNLESMCSWVGSKKD